MCVSQVCVWITVQVCALLERTGYYGVGPSCTPCSAGTFSSVAGAAICTSCAKGKWSGTSAITCTSCPAYGEIRVVCSSLCPCARRGTFSNVLGASSSACVGLCALGAYCTGGATNSTQFMCPAGLATLEAGCRPDRSGLQGASDPPSAPLTRAAPAHAWCVDCHRFI